MKKMISAILTVAMLLSVCCCFTGCGGDDGAYTVGICQLMEHESLDQATQGFIDALTAETPKTEVFAEQVKNLGFEQVLFVTKQLDENVYLASRNLPNVLVLEAQQVDPYSLLRYKKVIITKDAVAQLEEQWV